MESDCLAGGTRMNGEGRTTHRHLLPLIALALVVAGTLAVVASRWHYAHVYAGPTAIYGIEVARSGVLPLMLLFQLTNVTRIRAPDASWCVSEESDGRPIASASWKIFWLGEVVLRLVMLRVSRPKGKPIIFDRYIEGLIVDAAADLGDAQFVFGAIAHMSSQLAPEPSRTIFLDVEPDVAFSRKANLPPLEYLTDQRGMYHEVCQVTSSPHQIVAGPRTRDGGRVLSPSVKDALGEQR